MGRQSPAQDPQPGQQAAELSLRQGLQLVPCKDHLAAFLQNAAFGRHGGGSVHPISGEHYHLDPGPLESPDRIRRLGPQGIPQQGDADQGPGLRIPGVKAAQGQCPCPQGGLLFHGGGEGGAVKGDSAPIRRDAVPAAGQQLLPGSFHQPGAVCEDAGGPLGVRGKGLVKPPLRRHCRQGSGQGQQCPVGAVAAQWDPFFAQLGSGVVPT